MAATGERPRASARSADGPEGRIEVTQLRSGIGTKPKHRGTLRALGLRGIGQRNVLPDRPEIRGMIERVAHLVSVRPAGEADASSSSAATSPSSASSSEEGSP